MDTIFSLGKSRGVANARKVISDENPSQVGISDDYGAYENVFQKHQLCWAHPHRKLRDLADSKALNGNAAYKESFEAFRKLYSDIQNLLNRGMPFEKKQQRKLGLMKRFNTIAQAKDGDPQALAGIKKTLLKKKQKYFVCLEVEGISMDNNKAERGLRPLVIKRKISFGSKTDKGAKNLGILFSVVMSLWWKRPPNFFSAYANLLTKPSIQS